MDMSLGKLRELVMHSEAWHAVIHGFPKSQTWLSNWTELNCGSAGKESTCNVEDLSSIPVLGRSPGEGKGYPLPYSGLKNSMDSLSGCKKSDRTNFHSLWLICSKHFLKAKQYDQSWYTGTLYLQQAGKQKKLWSLRFYIEYKSNVFILKIWNYECYYVTNIHEKYLCYTPKRSKLTGWPPTVRVTRGTCMVMSTETRMRCPRPRTPKRASPVAQP